jgi:ABC-type branched-subunit amino acid transport system substrate-binding protein
MSGEYSCAMKLRSITVALVLLAALAAGCSSGGLESGAHVTVYVSVPLRGADAAGGREVLRGARSALAQADGRAGGLKVRAVYLDDARGRGRGARWTLPAVAANARRATEDSTAVAYIGELDQRASRTSEAITSEAGILQVAPRAGSAGAGHRAMDDVLHAITSAADSGDERGAVRDAYLER